MADSALFTMLAALSKSPKKMAAFKKDPDAEMAKYGLTKKQMSHLKSALKGKPHLFNKIVDEELYKQFDKLFC